MVGRGLKKLAKENGMKVDKGVAYGDFRGYNVTFSEGAGYKMMVIATTFRDPQAQFFLETQLNGKNLMKEFRVQEVSFTEKNIAVVFHDNPGTMKKMEAFFDWFFPFLDEQSATKSNICVECGEEITSGQWKLIDGTAYYMHPQCAQSVVNAISQEEESFKESQTGTYAGGFLGAMLGALLGAVLWAVVYSIGYVASLVGFVIGWLAEKGYHLLRGKNGKGKIAILIVAVIFGVLIGTLLGETISILLAIGNGELEGLAYGDIPLFLVFLLMQGEYLMALLADMGIGLLFAGLGIFALLRRANKEVADTKISDLK